MSHRTVLWLLLAGSVAAMVMAVRRSAPAIELPDEPIIVRAHERPWLATDALDQVFGDAGLPGPLFADLVLGGRAPSTESRARIAKFEKDHDVEIHLDTKDDVLVAIRFAVTFGGCCGYEAADKLGSRLARPWTENGCPAPKEYLNTWSYAASPQVELRAHVAVNRVEVRWEAIPTLAQLLARAETLIGQNRQVVGEAYGDHWRELESDHLFLLEVPYPFGFRREYFGEPPKLVERDDLGFKVTVDRGVVTGVKLVIHQLDDYDLLRDALEKRWGRPRKRAEGETSAETWRWHKPGLAITATPEDVTRTVEITASRT